MTANIYWEKIDPKPKDLGVGAPSSFIDSLKKAGLGFPCELDHKAVPVLAGMAAMWEHKNSTNPYAELVEIINKNGRIKVWAEY
jgi:hypothetical protein